MSIQLKFRDPILHVEVTKRDWIEASRLVSEGDLYSGCCPNALACNRALARKFRRHANLLRAEVTSRITLFDNKFDLGSVRLPRIARNIVLKFDAGQRSAPPHKISFDLDLRGLA